MTNTTARALPDRYEIVETRWNNLDEEQQKTVLLLLKEGGAVSIASVRQELPHATTFLLLTYAGVIVGVGAIKSERVRYAELVQSDQRSGYPFDPKTLELGYVVVAEDHRNKGLSGDITSTLLNRYKGALFATTDKENMKCSLSHRGFKQHGKEWKGNRGTLSLWLRE
jgi:hypothetical protein